MSHRISGTVPRMPAAAGPGPAQAEASQAAPPAPSAPTPGGLARRSARGQEQANHQLRQAIRSVRHPGVPAAAAEGAVRAAMAQGAEPSARSRSEARVLTNAQGTGNTALHYLAMYGTPDMARAVIHEPLAQQANLDANTPSARLPGRSGRGATPLHLAVESFNGPVLRDLLAIPGADVRRSYYNPARAARAGSHEGANMTVIETAEALAMDSRNLRPRDRHGLVVALRALVDHVGPDGYTVHCGPLTQAVQELGAPRPARGAGVVAPPPLQWDVAPRSQTPEGPPPYGAHQRNTRLVEATADRSGREDVLAGQPGPSSPRRPPGADEMPPPPYEDPPGQAGPSSRS